MRSIFQRLANAATALSVWPVVADVVAGAGLVLALVAPSQGATLIAVVAAWCIVAYRTRRGLLATKIGVGSLAQYLVARYLMLAAVAANSIVDGSSTPSLLVAVAGLAFLMGGERIVRSLNGYAAPYAANFPGEVARNRARFRYGYIYSANLVALALFVVDAFIAWSVRPVVFVILLGALVLSAAAIIDSVQRVSARKRFEASLAQRLADYAPQFYLHWHAPAGTTYQVEMWLPYLERIGVPFAIIARTVGNFSELSKLTGHPVLYRKDLEDLDPIITSSLKGAFYVNTATRNNHLVRYSHLVHIQLNHGDSDKVPSFNPIFRMYDLDFVAGQAAIDRFAANGVTMPAEMFRVVGRPQVENVEAASLPIADIDTPRVLYAPTWGGFYDDSNYSSLLAGPSIVRNLVARGCEIVFRPHPYTNRNPQLAKARGAIEAFLAADQAASGRQHLFGTEATLDMSVVDCFNASDAMISDVSSVVGDYLHSGKPFVMVSTRDDVAQFEEKFPMAQASYILQAERDVLIEVDAVFDALLISDPKRDFRAERARYYLGDIPRDGYADTFINTAREELGIINLSHLG